MATYIEEICTDIQQTMEEASCQPILFVGSGFSRRYFGAPNWEGLLQLLIDGCAEIERPLAYYKQRNKHLIDIGQDFAALYQQWAWDKGRVHFPAELFDADQPPDAYIKHAAAQLFIAKTPKSLAEIADTKLTDELSAVAAIQPHAIITTNYDTFLELLFPDFQPVIGQHILRREYDSIGEIFKIHGCVTEPNSLVLTRADYDDFARKKKYISAKLLTHLTEHPVLFLGYSATDPNVCSILADIDEILSPDGALIPNMYFLEWDPKFDPKSSYSREKLVQVGEHRAVRVKSIHASDFEWVYKAFAPNAPLLKVNTKLLRALLARMYDLIRVDIPRQAVQVDYSVLQNALSSPEDALKLLGIASLDKPGAINANYPYTLTEVATKLGYRRWHSAQDLIDRIRKETGKDIKASDNAYHSRLPMGKAVYRKYSDKAIGLLLLAKKGEKYELEGVP